MQNYKEINGNDYVKDSRTTINETMRSIQSMNSGTVFPTTNLFEGMKCYRTDLKKTYTLTDVENNTWVEDAHATLSDEATHAESATKLDTARSLNLGGAVTADAATFDGTANATINVKTLDATKLKGTASVSTTGNAATATKVVTTAAAGTSANIAEATMASSDSARIRVSGAENAGELALETADDGSEPIVARQYTGTYTTPVRTAKILDESGNTSFPGTVVAPKFTGALNGNSATATKLQTPRTLSLTGKAAGSTIFDGSANAAINVTSVNADTASKLSTARKINITGNATGSASFDGSGDVSISTTVNESKHAAAADTLKSSAATETSTVARPVWLSWEGDNTKQTVSPNLTYTCSTKTLTAANFKGHLAGNADTATTANTATKVNATAPNGGATDLVFGIMANDDSARIRIGGSSDNGWLEIATLDNGNEPIYARQYSGGFGQNDAKTVTNEAVLLDGNGNTKFPHNVTAANFVGHLAATADNADTVDGVHAGSMYYNKGNWTADNWATMGTYQVNNNPPTSNCYTWGQVISISTNDGRFQLYASHQFGGDGRLHYRTGWDNDKSQPWNTILDSENYNLFAPTKTGGGASGTWGINISGTATNANSASLISPFEIATANTFRNVWFSDSDTNNKACYNPNIQYNPSTNVLKVGTVQGNLAGNADNATKWSGLIDDHATENNTDTWLAVFINNKVQHVDRTKMTVGNADKLDGYHASDIINRISAANTGGIVAASLTENGYVKFANGLILQWGSHTGGGSWYHHTFQIAFSTVFDVIDGYSSTNTGQFYGYSKNITNTGFDMRIDSSETGRYIAIGI